MEHQECHGESCDRKDCQPLEMAVQQGGETTCQPDTQENKDNRDGHISGHARHARVFLDKASRGKGQQNRNHPEARVIHESRRMFAGA